MAFEFHEKDVATFFASQWKRLNPGQIELLPLRDGEGIGQTNAAGELILSGFTAGPCIVTVVHKDKVSIIGQQASDRIVLPGSNKVGIKPIRLELSRYATKALKSKKGYDQYQSKAATRAVGDKYQTKRPGGTLKREANDSDAGGAAGATARANHNTTRSNKTVPVAPDVDDDCDGVIEIMPLPGGQVKIKVTCK